MTTVIVIDNIERENFDTCIIQKVDSLSFKIPKEDGIGYDKISTSI